MRGAALLLALALAACDPEPTSRPGKRAGTRGDPFGAVEAGPATSAALGYRRAFALVVGVSRYASPSLGSLDGTVFDAEEVAALLSSRYGMKTTLLVDREGPPLTRARLLEALAALKKDVGRDDALLFFYAGHGVPGRLVPADAEPAKDPGAWKNLVGFAELGAALRACDAHHTLVVLDSCFSGSALAEGSPLREAVGTLGDASLRVTEADNLARVFNRRSFQVLTAGTGGEEVEDLAKISRDYAGLGKDLEKHSPFTGVLLQALRGLTGRPDGRVPASDLGYYVKHVLVNENDAFKARQAPQFGALGGGDGDFLFLPAQRVLNPRLVAPLYMPGAEYAELRASAAAALAEFVGEAVEAERGDLAKGAAAHLARLLRDAQPEPRKAAARAVRRLARLSDDFARCVPILTGMIAGLLGDDDEKDLAAEALGALAPHADAPAVAAMDAHLSRLRSRFLRRAGEEGFAGRPWPAELLAKQEALRGAEAPAAAPPPARLAALEKARDVAAWNLREGMEILRRLERRHQEGRAQLGAAEKAVASRTFLDARRSAAAAEPLLWAQTEEWTRAQEILRTTPDLRPIWRVAPPEHHAASLRRIARSGDGTRLATADEEGTIRWWDAASGRLLGELPKAAPQLAGLALSDDGLRLVWASRGGLVERWDLAARSRLAQARMLREVRGFVALDGRAERVAVGMMEGTIGLLDPAEPEKAVFLRGHGNAVLHLALHRSSATLVSGTLDAHIGFWSLPKGELLRIVPGGQAMIACMAVHEERAEVIWGLHDWSFHAASIRGEEGARGVGKLKGLPYWISVRPGGEQIVIASESGGLLGVRYPEIEVVWANATLVPTDVGSFRRSEARSDLGIAAPNAVFSPDGARLWMLRGRGIVALDAATGREEEGDILRGRLSHVSYSPDGRRLVTSGARVLIWDGERPRALDHEGTSGVAAWFTPDGRRLLIQLETTLLAVEAASEKVLWSRPLKGGAPLRMSRDGREVVVGDEKVLRILDAETGETRRELKAPFEVTALALHPGGKLVAVGGRQTEPALALLELGEGREIWRRRTGKSVLGSTSALAFDADGLLLASGDEDGSVVVWRVRSGEEDRALSAPDLGSVRDLAFGPDGQWFAAAGRQVRVWDLKARREALNFETSAKAAVSIAFTPTGRGLAAVGLDGSLMIWKLGVEPESRRLPGPPDGITWMAVAPAGDVYVAGRAHQLYLCSTRTGEIRRVIEGEVIGEPGFSSDGRRLAALLKRGLTVFDVADGKTLLEVPAEHGAISPDGERVAVLAGHQGRVVGLDGKEQGSFQGLQGANLSRCVWVRDGLLFGDDAGELRIWKADSGRTQSLRRATGDGIYFLAATAAGDRAAAAWIFGQALRVDPLDGRVAPFGPQRRKDLNALTFSPDGKLLLFAWSDGVVCLWDVAADKAQAWFQANVELPSLAWHPDGRRFYGWGIGWKEIRVIETDWLGGAVPAIPGLMPSWKEVDPLPAWDAGGTADDRVLAYRDLDAALRLEGALDPEVGRLLARRLVEAGKKQLESGQAEAARERFAQAKARGAEVAAFEASLELLSAAKAGRWEQVGPLLAKAKGLDETTSLLLRLAALRRTGDAEGEKRFWEAQSEKFSPFGPPGELLRCAKGEIGPEEAAAHGGQWGNWPAEGEGRMRAWLALFGVPGQAELARRLLPAGALELDLLPK